MRALAGLAVLVLFASCQAPPPPEMTEAEREAIQTEVMSVGDQLMVALSDLDPGVAAGIYDPATMHGNDGATYYATYDEWVTHNEELFARFEEADGSWRNVRVDVLAPDIALLVGQNEMLMTQVGGERTNIQGYITVVLRKIDGSWKIIHQASVGRWTPIEEG